jgi:hypothetical protein
MIAQRRRPHAAARLNSPHIQLRRTRKGMPYQSPIHEVHRVIYRHPGMIFESRCCQKVVRPDSNDRWVRIEPGYDRVAVRSYRSRRHDDILSAELSADICERP